MSDLRHFTATCARDLSCSPEEALAAWLDPEARARFETPEGSGMSHETVATEPDREGSLLVEMGGEVVGRMHDTIRMIGPGHVVVQGRGVFGGATTMAMQNSVTVTPREGGCTLTGTSQMAVLGDHPTEAEVVQGWEAMLDRFASVLNERRSE